MFDRSSRRGRDALGIVPSVTLTLVVLTAGCAPSAPPAATARVDDSHKHDGHGHDHGGEAYESPNTIAAGIAELEKVCASVKAELAAGKHDQADAKVHMVGHLLDDLRGLVTDSKPAAEVEQAAKKALDDIFDCFDKMDTALHAADESVKQSLDYADHAPTIEAATKTLRDLFQ
jgi:hypothetical protein